MGDQTDVFDGLVKGSCIGLAMPICRVVYARAWIIFRSVPSTGLVETLARKKITVRLGGRERGGC